VWGVGVEDLRCRHIDIYIGICTNEMPPLNMLPSDAPVKSAVHIFGARPHLAEKDPVEAPHKKKTDRCAFATPPCRKHLS
jgi:hypothetical protein